MNAAEFYIYIFSLHVFPRASSLAPGLGRGPGNEVHRYRQSLYCPYLYQHRHHYHLRYHNFNQNHWRNYHHLY